MSVVTHNVLKLLSDLSAAADGIVEENASELMLPRIVEWATIIKNKADGIAESENFALGEIQKLKSFLKGRGVRGLRVSTVLTGIQKSHLYRSRASIKTVKNSRKSSTPLQRKSIVKDKISPIGRNKNETINNDSEEVSPKMPSPTINDETEFFLNQNVPSTSSAGMNGKNPPLGSLTPVYESTTAMEALIRDKGSSKRKSSPEISLNAVKKPRTNKNLLLSDPKVNDESTKDAKVEKLTKANDSSRTHLSNNANVAVLKENRTLRSKIEYNNKMAQRKQKVFEENKRTKEEKLEKTIQQRMKLEQEKMGKLRSGGGPREKLLKKTPKEATPKVNEENKNKTLGGGTSNSGKGKEKQTSVKKMNQKKAGASTLKINEKTPMMRTLRQETQKVMNTTYAAGEESISSKKATLKDANAATNFGNKTVPKVLKQEQIKQPISTPKPKKGPESYAITPDRSSFVSYDISEIRSDSEDEEQETNSKPIPSWATGIRLRNALFKQLHSPIDTDELFGNYFDPPDLVAIMGVKKKHYNKRTSSAIWDSSFAIDK